MGRAASSRTCIIVYNFYNNNQDISAKISVHSLLLCVIRDDYCRCYIMILVRQQDIQRQQVIMKKKMYLKIKQKGFKVSPGQ